MRYCNRNRDCNSYYRRTVVVRLSASCRLFFCARRACTIHRAQPPSPGAGTVAPGQTQDHNDNGAIVTQGSDTG